MATSRGGDSHGDDYEERELRDYRHNMEGRMQFASMEALTKLTQAVSEVTASVAQVTKLAGDTAESLSEVRSWLMDSYDPSGKPKPGVLSQVNAANIKLSAAMNLLRIIAGAALTTAIASIVNGFHLFGH